MSESPPEADPVPASSLPPPSGSTLSKRPWTILGRLSKALREQNWFAVALELAIVVLGVVIGFQVTAWGQERADRAKEQTYLQQLAEDLRSTERILLWADSTTRPFDSANSKLVRAFFAPEPPPPDSILRWYLDARGYRPLLLVTGTADALIASGDLDLIRSDSLRTQITYYVPFVKSRQAEDISLKHLWGAEAMSSAARYDVADVLSRTMGEGAIDSAAVSNLYFVLPSGERRQPFSVAVDAMLADGEAYHGFYAMLVYKDAMRFERQMTLDVTRQLLSHVTSELAR